MEVKTQTSFIPKKNFTPQPSFHPARHTSPLTLIAACIFMLSVALAIGVFGYNIYLGNRISTSQNNLTNILAAISAADVSELSRTDNRIQSATKLLANHVDPSNLFTFLQATTLQNVRFADFKYVVGDNQKISLTMNGQARSFSDVALQANEFSSDDNLKYFHNPTFSNLSLDTSGNVAFLFTTDVDPKAFLYNPVAQTAPVAAPAPVATSTTTH